jgi:hypothetical protein
MVLKKDTCLFLLSNWVGVLEGEVAATFTAPEGWGGSECVFRLAHFIRGLGIATPEEEPWAPPVLSFFLLPPPLIGCAKKGCYTCRTSAITVLLLALHLRIR